MVQILMLSNYTCLISQSSNSMKEINYYLLTKIILIRQLK